MNEERKYEYVLGVNDFGGYEILEHTLNPQPHEFDAGVVFYVNDWSMGDGDGVPARYVESIYKTIPESVYEEVMRLFRGTGDKIDNLADEAEDLNREIRVGDYLYCGGHFIYVGGINSLSGSCWIKKFYYDYYDLNFDENTEFYLNINEWFEDFEIEDLSEFQVINKEIYEKALNIAKSGILEVKDYLKNILTGK